MNCTGEYARINIEPILSTSLHATTNHFLEYMSDSNVYHGESYKLVVSQVNMTLLASYINVMLVMKCDAMST